MSSHDDHALDPNPNADLTELYQKWYERLRQRAYREACDKAHKIDPSQIALDALIQAALRQQQFRGTTEQEFWRWLCAILVNQVREGLRRAECRTVSLQSPQACVELPSQALDPAVGAVKAEESLTIGLAIERLAPDDREVICLYHRSDLARPLIAAMLGISEVMLRKRAERARKRLKMLLQSTPPREAYQR